MPAQSEVSKIRRKIYTTIARWTLQDELLEKINDLPDDLIKEFDIRYRCCEHKEKAILKERIRIALGLAPDEVRKHDTLAQMAANALTHQHDSTHVVEMIEAACDRCPIDKIVVTDACRNCVAHHCLNSCPKNAIMIVQNRAYIDRNRCVNCGLCAKSCRYHAIVQITRPCEQACALDAISPTDSGSASIDYKRCVSCGSCISACPFGSVADDSQIIPVIQMLKQREQRVVALVAPSFVGQFGPKVQPSALAVGLRQLGFTDVVEVAKGAEMVARAEADEYLERMAAGQSFMTSSCCPAFVGLIEKHYSQFAPQISHTPSPMAVIAREVKRVDPTAVTVFIGPCVAKKAEAARARAVEAVLTFEELACLLSAADIDLTTLVAVGDINDAGAIGRGFAKSGGVANAVLGELGTQAELLKLVKADGLVEAQQLLKTAAKGCLAATFVEGMACQGGCIAGPGTIVDKRIAERALDRHCQESQMETKQTAAGSD
ncbi:MAG: monomeric [FeFe] hydrogenase [Bacillota bacterium]